MNKFIRLTALTLFLAAPAATVRAASDVNANDAKNAANEKIDMSPKKAKTADKKATTKDAAPAAKKKHKGLFDGDALHKDRSLPSDDKVPMTDDKKREAPYKNLNQDLHKDRG